MQYTQQNFNPSFVPKKPSYYRNNHQNFPPQKFHFQNQNLKAQFEKFGRFSHASYKVKSMLQHVSNTLIQLLQNLKYLYQTNGINYSVHGYHNTLMRLLTPHQLLSHFHIIDNHRYFIGSQQDKARLTQCKYRQKQKKVVPQMRQSTYASQQYGQENQKYQEELYMKRSNKIFQRQNKNSNRFIQEQERNKNNENFNISSLDKNSMNKNKEDWSLRQKTQLYEVKLKNNTLQSKSIVQKSQGRPASNEKFILGTKPMLDYQTEKQIGMWVISQLCNNRTLKMKQIAIKAKQLAGKVRGFRGSLGWVNRYLTRYPSLKKLLRLAKIGNFQMLRNMSIRIKDQLQNPPSPQLKLKNQTNRNRDSQSSFSSQIDFDDEEFRERQQLQNMGQGYDKQLSKLNQDMDIYSQQQQYQKNSKVRTSKDVDSLIQNKELTGLTTKQPQQNYSQDQNEQIQANSYSQTKEVNITKKIQNLNSYRIGDKQKPKQIQNQLKDNNLSRGFNQKRIEQKRK